MNPQTWWYLARASGIVAWVLLAASVAWGLFLSTRLLGRRAAPAWLLDLHRFLGGLAVLFTAIHLAGLVADSFVYFGPAELFVPMASDWQPGAVAWGIVAFYLLVAVEGTSLLMRHLPRRLWRGVHVSSFAAFFLAGIHGATAGSDATNVLYVWTSVVLVGATVFMTLVRLLAQRRVGARRGVVRPTGATAA